MPPLRLLFQRLTSERGVQWFTWLLIGVYLPLQLFILLAILIQIHPNGLGWDMPVLLWMQDIRRPAFDAIVKPLTNLGVYWGVVPIACLIMLGLVYQRHWRSLSYFTLCMIGNIAMNRTAKFFFHRERPHLWDSPLPEHGFSFPSGHAMASMALVSTILVLVWGTRWFPWAFSLGAIFVSVIAGTRIYLGVHYPSDILGGWLLSLAWGIGLKLLFSSLGMPSDSLNRLPKPSEIQPQ